MVVLGCYLLNNFIKSDEYSSCENRAYFEGGAVADGEPVQGLPDLGADVGPRVQEQEGRQRSSLPQVSHPPLHR
jgi:hypothetical protein